MCVALFCLVLFNEISPNIGSSLNNILVNPAPIFSPNLIVPKIPPPPSPKPIVPLEVISNSAPPVSQNIVSTPVPVNAPVPGSNVSNLVTTSPSTSSSTTSSSNSFSTGSNISYTSTNWAGYMSSGEEYTTISGSWVVPSVSGVSGQTSSDASWIGIGGVSPSTDLIQLGSEDTVSSSGVVSRAIFYELIPSAAYLVSGFKISAGDNLSASINETSTNYWDITLTDITTGQVFQTNVSYDSSNSSAEWIEEDPAINGNVVALDNFGSVTFSQASTTANNTSVDLLNSSPSSITMVNSAGQPIVKPSSINSSGNGFTLTQS